MINMEGREGLPIRRLALVWVLVLTLTVLAFCVVYFIWRPALEMLFFGFIPDRFIARLLYMVIFVGMMFAVALSAAFGEPVLERATRQNRHWRSFLKIGGGLLLFGAAGLLISTVLGQGG